MKTEEVSSFCKAYDFRTIFQHVLNVIHLVELAVVLDGAFSLPISDPHKILYDYQNLIIWKYFCNYSIFTFYYF